MLMHIKKEEERGEEIGDEFRFREIRYKMCEVMKERNYCPFALF